MDELDQELLAYGEAQGDGKLSAGELTLSWDGSGCRVAKRDGSEAAAEDVIASVQLARFTRLSPPRSLLDRWAETFTAESSLGVELRFRDGERVRLRATLPALTARSVLPELEIRGDDVGLECLLGLLVALRRSEVPFALGASETDARPVHDLQFRGHGDSVAGGLTLLGIAPVMLWLAVKALSRVAAVLAVELGEARAAIFLASMLVALPLVLLLTLSLRWAMPQVTLSSFGVSFGRWRRRHIPWEQIESWSNLVDSPQAEVLKQRLHLRLVGGESLVFERCSGRFQRFPSESPAAVRAALTVHGKPLTRRRFFRGWLLRTGLVAALLTVSMHAWVVFGAESEASVEAAVLCSEAGDVIELVVPASRRMRYLEGVYGAAEGASLTVLESPCIGTLASEPRGPELSVPSSFAGTIRLVIKAEAKDPAKAPLEVVVLPAASARFPFVASHVFAEGRYEPCVWTSAHEQLCGREAQAAGWRFDIFDSKQGTIVADTVSTAWVALKNGEYRYQAVKDELASEPGALLAVSKRDVACIMPKVTIAPSELARCRDRRVPQ